MQLVPLVYRVLVVPLVDLVRVVPLIFLVLLATWFTQNTLCFGSPGFLRSFRSPFFSDPPGSPNSPGSPGVSSPGR